MKKTNIKKIILTLIAALLAVSMCFAFAGCSDSEPKNGSGDNNAEEPDPNDTGYIEVLDNYLTCLYSSFDYDDCMECYVSEQREDMSHLEYTLENNEEVFESNDLEVTWDIDSVEAESIENIDDIKASYKDNYDLDVVDGREVSIEVTTIEDGEESVNTNSYAFVKIDGNWYVCNW